VELLGVVQVDPVRDALGGPVQRVQIAVGQPVTVFLERSLSVPGLALPIEAVVRLSSGERIVYEKVSAERFVPRSVRVRQVSGDRVAVLAGLEPGARVVVRGAALVTQIR
jgi:hypothetical protein